MVSHLVGGEAHAAQRVQVQVLLLPPRSGVPGDRSSSLGWTVALGMWEAHPVRGGTYLRGMRVRLAPLPPVLKWSVPPTVRQSGLNPEAPTRDDCSTQLRSSRHVWPSGDGSSL